MSAESRDSTSKLEDEHHGLGILEQGRGEGPEELATDMSAEHHLQDLCGNDRQKNCHLGH